MRKSKWILPVLIAAVLLTGCGKEKKAGISDETGDFVYTGELQRIGNDEVGYIQVPDYYGQVESEELGKMLRYADADGYNCFTLGHYADVDYQTAANNISYMMQQSESIAEVNGAVVTVAEYNAMQIYGRYTDGLLFVIWLVEDPALPESSYYLEIQCESAQQNLIACSSTFETTADHNASGNK